MISISDRLLSIASFIDSESVIDIGCDHGLLDVYLTINKNCKCMACDVNVGIIDRARSNFMKYEVLDKIDLFVGNGYDDLKIDYSYTMVLSGMGTATILKILDKNKTHKIICQTNTDLYDLRKGICDMGYYIFSENIIFENNRYYVTIVFLPGKKEYSYDDYLLGPILRLSNSNIFDDYINNLYRKNIKGYNKAIKFNSSSLSELKLLINTLEKYM